MQCRIATWANCRKMQAVENNFEELQSCIEVLHGGGTILYPTDTIWGIGCDATNEEAVQKIYRVKQRVESKSMLVLVADRSQLEKFATVPLETYDLLHTAERPLTIIYPTPFVSGATGS